MDKIINTPTTGDFKELVGRVVFFEHRIFGKCAGILYSAERNCVVIQTSETGVPDCFLIDGIKNVEVLK